MSMQTGKELGNGVAPKQVINLLRGGSDVGLRIT